MNSRSASSLVWYNQKVMSASEVTISLHDRGFRYGDGIFETCYYSEGQIRFFDDHYMRLLWSIQKMGFEMQIEELKTLLLLDVKGLVEKNGLPDPCKIRISIWRKEGGLYTPLQNKVNILVEALPISYRQQGINVARCESVKVSIGALSGLKTANALPYVLASLEKKQRNLDDVILCNEKGDVCEASSSNIFVRLEGEEYFTPADSSGCLKGVMRKQIKNGLILAHVNWYQGPFPYHFLSKAKSMYLSSALQVVRVNRIDDLDLNLEPDPILEGIVETLQNAAFLN